MPRCYRRRLISENAAGVASGYQQHRIAENQSRHDNRGDADAQKARDIAWAPAGL